MPLKNGDIFAGYTIQRLLGAGGMGEVYLAQHPRLPRLDALKILSTDATGDKEFRARFVREAELAATLWHPHIVGVHDRGEFNGQLWISMDFVDGTDAGHLLERTYPQGMPHADVVEIVTAVAEALDFAHERRLLHRDVKPANILVTDPSEGARRRVLLTDFGIAREADDVSGLTEANMAIGTVTYAAPEQLTGQSLDGRADQYALAATTFHLLTGTPLFDNSNRAVVVGNHLHTPPPALSERRPDLAEFDTVIAKALAKNPADRYQRCLDFAQALGGCQDAGVEGRGAAETDAGGQAAAAATAVHTAPFDLADDRGSATPPHTRRLDLMTVLGTARAVNKRPAGPDEKEEVWSFRVERYDSTGEAHTVVPVELRGSAITGQLRDGDVVEVNGFWDDRMLFADGVINHSASTGRRSPGTAFKVRPGGTPWWRSRKTLTAVFITMVAATAVVALVVTGGFGLWSNSRPGPIVKPERATVFSPGGAPDHPGQANLAIDGDPNTSWPTDVYRDAVPFPAFKQGVGLILQLAEPTALSEVTIDVPSTGTEVQIRAADSPSPAALSDTTELTPVVQLKPGSNTITIDDQTKTADVLVWIAKLGTTDGQSRTEISDITLRAAS
ncbi:MAG: serine/threonine-protein kinase [Mycolicibacterium sp.]|uniref:serine/threonine-protein kinase n=1 Tax=Mycolicibacterium sp. TaxID=2320850 RepID=UPI003D13BE32